jgi:hypothetical protein
MHCHGNRSRGLVSSKEARNPNMQKADNKRKGKAKRILIINENDQAISSLMT